MPLQYSNIEEIDLGGGIDARSSENKLTPSYAEDLLNADTIEKRLRKRAGYQGYAGYVPVRVDSVQQIGNEITFSLDDTIDLSNVRSSPLVVYGRTDATTGRFTTSDSIRYYPEFIADPRKLLTEPTGTLAIPATDHGLTTNKMSVGTVISLDNLNLDNEQFIPDNISIDQSTLDVDLDYVVAADTPIFVYYKDRAASPGTVHIESFTLTASPSQTISIPLTTHALDNLQLLVEVYEDDAGTYRRRIPDNITINPSSGLVEVTFNTITTLWSGIIILSTTAIANSITGSITAASSATFSITSPDNTFPFLTAWEETTPGGPLNQIIPDTVTYNSSTNQIDITFTNGGPSVDIEIYYDFGKVITNKLTVIDSTSASESTSNVQLTIWGLCHEEIYSSLAGDKAGWVSHIDSYKRVGEARPVCGLGGNIFASRDYSESAVTHAYPTVYPSIRSRVLSDVVIGPLFYGTGETPARTRGYITGTAGITNFFRIESATYDFASGYMDYLITIPDKGIFDAAGATTTLASVIATNASDPDMEDYLTVQQMNHSVLNGTFKIISVTDGTDQITVRVDNPDITAPASTVEFPVTEFTDFDEVNAAGDAGVFTDQLTLLGVTSPRQAQPFIPGDQVISDVFGAGFIIEILQSKDDVISTSGVTGVIEVPGGLRVRGKRTNSLVPMRNAAAVPDSTNVVRGDMLAYSDVDRLMRVKSVNPNPDIPVTVDSGTITFPTASSATDATINDTTEVITVSAAHGYISGTPVRVEHSTDFTTGLTPDQIYYVKVVDATSFTLSLTIGGADVDLTLGIDPGTLLITPLNTSAFGAGREFLLLNAGQYSGVQVVTAIPTTETMTFDTTVTGSTTAIIRGETVELDEELIWQDENDNTNIFHAPQRWIPVEAPDDAYALTPSTYEHYFDTSSYTSQPTIRSTMVNDTMFFTNGNDVVMKFDGQNIYRAGLFRWQPGLFISTDTTGFGAGEIELDLTTMSIKPTTGRSGATFTVTRGHERRFDVGDTVIDSSDLAEYKIVETDSDTTDGFVRVTPDISATADVTSGTLTSTGIIYRYYFRLNAVDANNNVIASAATGSENFRVALSGNAAVQLKLVGLPTWDIYDYDRLEVEIYRTQADQAAPFYRITSIPMEYNDNGDGYIIYTDRTSDDTLTDLDPVNSALLGAEIGTAWTDPIRAKYITSANNRLVLGNLQDYPQVDIQLLDNLGDITIALLDGVKWLFRRDDIASDTVTDNVDTITYEMVDASGPALTSTTGSGHYVLSSIVGTAGTHFNVTTGSAHGLVEGDWVYVRYAAVANGTPLLYTGWWQVAEAVSTTEIKINFSGAEAGAPATTPDQLVVATTRSDVPVGIDTDGNNAARNANSIAFTKLIAFDRLAKAVNTSMRLVDTTLTGQSTFVPWLTASAGGNFAPGQIIVRQPRSDFLDFEMVVPVEAGTDFSIFVNQTKRSAGNEISATPLTFPSRVVISYQNYPELFDNPTAVLQQSSDSVVDVNSADGQEITGIIPFFGDSATGAAQKEETLVVFKTNSIYLLNVRTRELNKLETQGLGCTAPFTIAAVQDGIMFANASGVYKIDRTFKMRYVGRLMERNWVGRVDRTRLDLATATNYPLERQYKISVPIIPDDGTTATTTSEVYVYDYEKDVYVDGTSGGNWSRFDNHPATGWANLESDAYFGSTQGRVFSIRRTGNKTDFRDDDAAINFEVIYRAMDFGSTAIRKAVANIVSHFRVDTLSEGTKLFVAADLRDEFEETTPFELDLTVAGDNLGDTVDRKVVSIRHSLGRRKLMYLQLKYTNNTIDEAVELAGFSIKVAPMTTFGITEAADTTK